MRQPLAYETLALELIDNDYDPVGLRAGTGGSAPGQLTPTSGIGPHATPTRKRRCDKEGREQASRAKKKRCYMRRPSEESVLFQTGRKAGRGLRLRVLEGSSLLLVLRTCRARLADVGHPGRGRATLTMPKNARIN
jgi:hypothetical protein